MGELAPKPYTTHAEYLALEEQSPTKHEWLDGVIYDRSGGTQFGHYRRIPSLAEYVLVSQHSPKIEVFRKNKAGKWVLAEEASAGEVAPLLSISCALSVDEVYADPLRESP